MSSTTKTQLVMTLIGKDRPGLVQALAHEVEAQGGNWLESRMAVLAEHFAGILRVEVPTGQVDALQRALSSMEQLGVKLTVLESSVTQSLPPRQPARLELTGYDRPGIVAKITEVLAGQNVNIDELETSLEQAAMSGQPTFTARAALKVPGSSTLDEVSEALETIGADLMVEIKLEEME